MRGRELWRVIQMSSHDHLCELFETDEVRMHFARVAGENLVSPDEKATGIGMYVFLGFLEKFGFGVAVGGAGSLTNALIACIEAHGGAVVADAHVREVTSAGGRATGVVLDDGTRHTAKDAIIGAIHPHLLPGMVPGMEPQAAKDALRTQITDAACITVHAALDAPLKFKAEGVDAVMVELMPDSYETLRRAFDDLRYGGFVRTPLIGLGSLSQFDPSRVPEGKAILHAWDYVPYDRPDGASWDDTKRAYADRMIDRIADFVPNIREVLLEGACRFAGRHGAHLAQLPARRPPRHRHHHLPVRRPPPDPRAGPVSRARLSTGSIWSARSSIPAAGSSARAARPRRCCSTISASTSTRCGSSEDLFRRQERADAGREDRARRQRPRHQGQGVRHHADERPPPPFRGARRAQAAHARVILFLLTLPFRKG
ncbi:MAG: hypothetical protein WDN24_16515 [Sphingomonas sp.]